MSTPTTVRLSVVAPAHNEEANLGPLVEEIVASLEPLGPAYEIIIVDDGSTDRTPDILSELQQEYRTLRVLRMCDTPPGKGNGQSAAFHAGFRAARGEWIVTLDADLQNDPGDIPAMLARQDETGADMVQGDRSQNRRDNLVRKISSWVGRVFRRTLLGDTITDTGCSLRIMRREVALAIPLQFRGMHRFIPVTARKLGYNVVEIPVNHRPRTAGATKYGAWDRAVVGIYDCLAVRWMARRRTPVAYDVVTGESAGRASARFKV
ncbi:MAG: glycosyltransferase family 2 protein [Acidobacteriota bacterium]|nr:glycosyltransferase family 2 protein [Acidobacteriota bacterium]